MRRTLKGEPIRPILPLVDIYNAVSLEHLLPVGGEDLDSIEGDLRLTRASESEPPVRLLGEAEERAPKPGEVIYTDDRGAICRRWNWKEADRTKLTESTRTAVLVLEALPPMTEYELRLTPARGAQGRGAKEEVPRKRCPRKRCHAFVRESRTIAHQIAIGRDRAQVEKVSRLKFPGRKNH